MNDCIIGFGTFPLKDVLTELIPHVQEYGYSILDTSDDYYNEEYVAAGAEGTNLRIFTKFSLLNNIFSFDKYFNQTEAIFAKYGLKVNCYLLHWPFPHLYKYIWRKMEDLYLSGRVEEIGVCNFTVQNLQDLLKDCRVKPMYNEIELHPLFQQKEITAFCAQNAIRVISYSPFARMDQQLFGNEDLKNIAQKHKTTVTNIILKWNLQKGFIPIPSTSKLAHLQGMSAEKLDQFELTNEEMAAIDSLDCGKRVRFNPETYFTKKSKIKMFIFSLFLR